MGYFSNFLLSKIPEINVPKRDREQFKSENNSNEGIINKNVVNFVYHYF